LRIQVYDDEDIDIKLFKSSEAMSISEVVRPHLQQGNSKTVPLLIKALANYIERTSTRNPTDVLHAVEQFLKDGNTSQALQRLLLHMVTVGVESDPIATRIYTTGEVARIFGVSVATINNWINQGRFQTVEKGERFKQVRIPENALFTASTGIKSTVAEVAQRYEQEQVRLGRNTPMTAAEELADLVNAVVHFEKKYQGTLENTLGKRKDLTPIEARDVEQWAGLVLAIERRQG
jgi:hypothetical protein